MPISKNTFSGGMVQDLDVHNQRPGTYRFAKNGQLIRNEGGDDGNGAYYAFSNIKGTELVSQIQNGYVPIAAIEVDEYILTLSTNGTNSQISRFVYDGESFSHQILFNDKNDPNGDKLGFFIPNPEEDYPNISLSFENEYTKRIYISDGRNQDRVFNLSQMFQGYDCEGILPLSNTPIHVGAGEVSSVPYPKHLSVHHMDLQMDLVYPKFKFKQRINGSLKRGAYQYAVRYYSDSGYRSNWQTPSLHVLVTGTHFPNNPEYLTEGNVGYSHHNREMATTGDDSIVNDGLKIEFKGLDTRWSGFEIAFLYSKVDSITHEAMICYKHKSNCGTTTFPSTFVFDHTKHAGIPISTDEFLGRDEVILSSKASINFEDRLYRFNVETLPNIDLDLSGAEISTKFRYLDCDDTIEPTFTAVSNPRTGRLDGDPLTNTTIKNSSVSISTFGSNTETYDIVNDYVGYKGQQIEHLFRQYMSGETYGIALVLIDRKGNTLFAQHIDDFTFPEQFDSVGSEECTLTKFDGGTYKLRIKGMLINNIRIPKNKIRDKYGKLNISGFKIVRTKRNGNILHQGVLVPVTDTVVSAGSSIQTGVQVKPHPFVSTNYKDVYYNGTSHRLNNLQFGPAFSVREEVDNENFVDVIDAVAGYSLYFSPDLMIEGRHDFVDTDTIKHVGTAYRAYVSDEIRLSGPPLPMSNYNLHFYGKQYYTGLDSVNGDTDLWQKYGRKKVGETSRLKFATLITDYMTNLKGFDKDATEIEFKNGVIDVAVHVTSNDLKRAKGVGAKNSVLLGMLDFEHIDIRNGSKKAGYRIVNYIRPNDNYLANENTGLDARLYQSTGHYQPITEEVLSSVDSDANDYIFNNVEVWGGDTFVSLFDFTRVVPAGTRNCSTEKTWANPLNEDGIKLNYRATIPDGVYPEFASSLIVPIESKYNLSLRFGRRFAKNATYPQSAYCDDVSPQYSGGIMSFQPESFAINSVLLHTENIVFFTQEPPDLTLLSRFENRIYVSDPKISSEKYDSFRRQKVLNYGDIDGDCGAIVAAKQAFSYIYVIQERGYGVLRARERAAVATTVGELIIGTGKDIAGIQYISKDTGCQNPKSIVSRRNSIWWVDKRNTSIVRHSQGGLEEVSKRRFVHEYVSKIEKAKDIFSGFDSDSGNYYVSVTYNQIQNNFTILFNDSVGFQSELSIIPLFWLSFGNKLLVFSSSNKNKLYLYGTGMYGEFFDGLHDTEIQFVINDASEVGKIFDNVFLSANENLFDNLKSVTFVGDNQKILTKASSTFISQRGNIKFPVMNKGERERLRGRVVTVKIVFTNLGNKQVLLNSFQTIYRIDR